MKKVLKEAVWIVLLAGLAGLAVNAGLLWRYGRGEFRDGFLSVPKSESIMPIDDSRALDLFEQGRALFIDSRSAEDFARGHIPRARNIPLGDPRQDMLIRSLSLDPSTPVVVYCSGGPCLDSLYLAQWLAEKGYVTEVMVYSGGWEAWTAAGFPVETNDVQK